MMPRSLTGKIVAGVLVFLFVIPLIKATDVDHEELRLEMQANRQSTQAAAGEGVKLGQGLKDEILGPDEGQLADEPQTVSGN